MISSQLLNHSPAVLLIRSTRYIIKRTISPSHHTRIIILLLLLAGVEPNPGPHTAGTSLTLGSFNVRSSIHKASLIHSLIFDNHLDILALNETWVSPDDPACILHDIAPDGFRAIHVPRPASQVGHRGGGLAVILPHSLGASTLTLTTVTSTFELQSLTLHLRRPVILLNIYRPPTTTPSQQFFTELTDLLLEAQLQSSHPVILCGDLNCPGDSSTTIDDHLSQVFSDLGFIQHIQSPTRGSNLLDIITSCSFDSIISSASVQPSHEISDHNLITAILSSTVSPPTMCSFIWRSLKKVNFDNLDKFLSNSSLIATPTTTECSVDEYWNQVESVVITELDKVAPIKKRSRKVRPSVEGVILSQEAVSAKRYRRKLERQWYRSGDNGIRQKYRAACRETNRLINASWKSMLSDKLKSISGSKLVAN